MRHVALAILAALALLLTGCGSDDSGPSRETPSPSALDNGGLRAPAAPAVGKSFQSESSSGNAASDRKEVTTGTVSIKASDPIDAAHKTAAKVESIQGRVDDRTEQPRTDDTDPTATLTVRVPADKTDQLIDDLRDFGEVTSVSLSKNDVTMQSQDLDARIKALQTSVDRLRALIANASNTSDLIEAEKAVSDRQGELDSLTSQQRRLNDQIDLSTLTIDFSTDGHSKSGDSDNFWDGIVSGWHSLVGAIGNIIVFIGKAIPWIGFIVLIGVVLWIVRRVVRKIIR